MFDRTADAATKQRVQCVIDRLTSEQVAAIEALATVKDVYYGAAKTYLTAVFDMILQDEEEISAQARVDLVLYATHVLVKAISAFALATAEVIVFGKPQAPIPMETSRILDVDFEEI
jgi:hypothetical protein